jgi:protein-L-isoaspartate(D-aspartate) O-methyltransferase
LAAGAASAVPAKIEGGNQGGVGCVAGEGGGKSVVMDFRQQRLNMVESQVRPSDVTDQRIIRAMMEVSRERFVPARLVSIAYIDDPVPVTADSRTPRCLLPPRTLAKMLQLLAIGPQSVVLDVGCATGYSTAVLARIAGRVVAVEAEPELARAAASTLQELGVGNAAVAEGPHAAGAPAQGRFDAILLNGAVPAVPPGLLDQLADRGRLAAVLRQGPVCRAHVWRRSGKAIDRQPAFDAAAAALPGFEAPAEFVF